MIINHCSQTNFTYHLCIDMKENLSAVTEDIVDQATEVYNILRQVANGMCSSFLYLF